MELLILSDNSQSSGDYHETKAEEHYCVDDSEDLWHCEHENKSSFAEASVDKETTKNADNDTFGEHNNREAEHVHEIVGNAGSSMEPYIIHSHGRGSLERLHHISSNGPGDHDVKEKQVDIKQDLSTTGDSISEGHSEQEMNKAEDSYITENSTPSSGNVGSIGDQEENMIKLQKLLMSGLQEKEKVLLTEYTSILRNYKNAKRKLTEVETKSQECLNEMTAMINELHCANAMKDEEIRLLREFLNSSTDKDASQNGHQMNPAMSLSLKSGTFRDHRRAPSFLSVHQRKQSVSSISRIIVKNSSLKNNLNLESPKEGDASHDVVTDSESLNLEDIKLIDVVEMENASPLEEKFRRDMLEEEIWRELTDSH